MDVLTKTKELCEALTDSPEFKELARTETILKHDPDAQDLIKRFNEAQNYLIISILPEKRQRQRTLPSCGRLKVRWRRTRPQVLI